MMKEQSPRSQSPWTSESAIRDLLRQIARIVVLKLPRRPTNSTSSGSLLDGNPRRSSQRKGSGLPERDRHLP